MNTLNSHNSSMVTDMFIIFFFWVPNQVHNFSFKWFLRSTWTLKTKSKTLNTHNFKYSFFKVKKLNCFIFLGAELLFDSVFHSVRLIGWFFLRWLILFYDLWPPRSNPTSDNKPKMITQEIFKISTTPKFTCISWPSTSQISEVKCNLRGHNENLRIQYLKNNLDIYTKLFHLIFKIIDQPHYFVRKRPLTWEF